jgi:glycosyltransferase involved in cell wall biosynthesis
MKRILIYTTLPDVGGNSTIALQLASQLIEMGWKVGVLTRSQAGYGYSDSTARQLATLGCEVRRLDANGKIPPLRLVGMLLWLLRFGWGARYLTIGMGLAGPIVGLCSHFRSRTFYLIQHDDQVDPLRRLRKWVRVFDQIAVISPESLKPASEWLGPAYEGRIHWLAQFCEITGSESAMNTHEGKVRAFGFIGSLAASKGIEVLLDQWRSDQNLPRLIVIGDGPLRSQVESAVAETNGRIVYRGKFSASDRDRVLTEAFREIDTLLVPITKEGDGIPTVIMEALSFGVPVITTPLGGMRAFQTALKPESDHIVDLSPLETFSHAVERRAREPMLTGDLHAACRGYFQKFFSNEVLRRSWGAVLNK